MTIKKLEASYDLTIPGLNSLLRLTSKVSPVDRPSRQTRHSRLSLRGWQAQFQENVSVLVSHVKIHRRRPIAFENVTALCFV